jgi:DNA-binding MarR family transcriptional regulator
MLRAGDDPAEASGGDVSLGELENAAGFLLRIAQLSAFERFFVVFGESDLKISELTVLLAVARNPGIRQGALADVLRIKWPNMTKLVRALEERGLLTRRISHDDRRSVVLAVTKAGRRRVDVSAARMYRSDREALSMLTDVEHAQLLALSRKIAGWPPAGSR